MTTLLRETLSLVTSEQLERMPEDCHFELIRGKLVQMAPPGGAHGVTGSRLALLLGAYIQEHELGETFLAETGFLIERSPDTVLAPDFAYVSSDRMPSVVPTGYLPLAPDLVIEVRSPGDSKIKVTRKAQRWLDAGTTLVLDLDPKGKSLTAYHADGNVRTFGIDDTFDEDQMLPGLKIPVRKLFR